MMAYSECPVAVLQGLYIFAQFDVGLSSVSVQFCIILHLLDSLKQNEPLHEKTNNLHMRKQRHRSAVQ